MLQVRRAVVRTDCLRRVSGMGPGNASKSGCCLVWPQRSVFGHIFGSFRESGTSYNQSQVTEILEHHYSQFVRTLC